MTFMFPYTDHFAYRMFCCLQEVCGTVSENEFLEWFDFQKPSRALCQFRKAALLIFMGFQQTPAKIEQFKRLKFGAKKNYLRLVRRKYCGAWSKPYGLYLQMIERRLTQEEFVLWWDRLTKGEQFALVHAWMMFLKKNCFSVEYEPLNDGTKITIRQGGGAESGIIYEI